MRVSWAQPPSMPLFGVVVWTCMMVVLDGMTFPRLAEQFLTVRNLSTQGTIVAQGISTEKDSDGDTLHRFWARYRYEVDGRTYEGDRVCHSPFGSDSGKNAWDLSHRFPEGASVPVYYRPDAPGDAVLLQGPQGADLFFLLFFMPFNVPVPLGWYLAVSSRRQRGRVHSFMSKGRTHVPLGGMGFVGAGLLTLWISSFVAAFVVGLVTGMNASRSVMLVIWPLVLVLSVAGGLWHQAKQNAGAYDLVLDERKERLSVPAMLGRSERLDLRLGQLQSLTTEPHLSQDSDGDEVRTWRPTLTFRDVSGRSEQVALADYKDAQKAELLVGWLSERLRLERRAQPDATRAV